MFALLDIGVFRSNKANIAAKIFAPGEARTPDLRSSLSVLTYKYDALTDCATGARTKLTEHTNI